MTEQEQAEPIQTHLFIIHDSTLDPTALAEQVPDIRFTALPWVLAN